MDPHQRDCLHPEEATELLLGLAEADRSRFAQHDTAEAWLAVEGILFVLDSHSSSPCVNEAGLRALGKLSTILSDRLMAEPPPSTSVGGSEDRKCAVHARRSSIAEGVAGVCLAAAERFPLEEGLHVAALGGLHSFLEALRTSDATETRRVTSTFNFVILALVGDTPNDVYVSVGVAVVLASAGRFPRNVSLQQAAWGIIFISCFSECSKLVLGTVGVANHRAVCTALAASLCDLLRPPPQLVLAATSSAASSPPPAAAAAGVPSDWAETTRLVIFSQLCFYSDGNIRQIVIGQLQLILLDQAQSAPAEFSFVAGLARCLQHEATWLASAPECAIAAATVLSPNCCISDLTVLCCSVVTALLTAGGDRSGGHVQSPLARIFLAAGGAEGAVSCIDALLKLAGRRTAAAAVVKEDRLVDAVDCACELLSACGDALAVLSAASPLFAPTTTNRVAWPPLFAFLTAILQEAAASGSSASGRMSELALRLGAMDAACTACLESAAATTRRPWPLDAVAGRGGGDDECLESPCAAMHLVVQMIKAIAVCRAFPDESVFARAAVPASRAAAAVLRSFSSEEGSVFASTSARVARLERYCTATLTAVLEVLGRGRGSMRFSVDLRASVTDAFVPVANRLLLAPRAAPVDHLSRTLGLLAATFPSCNVFDILTRAICDKLVTLDFKTDEMVLNLERDIARAQKGLSSEWAKQPSQREKLRRRLGVAAELRALATAESESAAGAVALLARQKQADAAAAALLAEEEAEKAASAAAAAAVQATTPATGGGRGSGKGRSKKQGGGGGAREKSGANHRGEQRLQALPLSAPPLPQGRDDAASGDDDAANERRGGQGTLSSQSSFLPTAPPIRSPSRAAPPATGACSSAGASASSALYDAGSSSIPAASPAVASLCSTGHLCNGGADSASAVMTEEGPAGVDRRTKGSDAVSTSRALLRLLLPPQPLLPVPQQQQQSPPAASPAPPRLSLEATTTARTVTAAPCSLPAANGPAAAPPQQQLPPDNLPAFLRPQASARHAAAAVAACTEAASTSAAAAPRPPQQQQETAAAPSSAAGRTPTPAAHGGDGDTDCCVCLERSRTHLLVPCGHVCVCSDCAALLHRSDSAAETRAGTSSTAAAGGGMAAGGGLCPLCREPFVQAVLVRF